MDKTGEVGHVGIVACGTDYQQAVEVGILHQAVDV
jgi:hypothetical protein